MDNTQIDLEPRYVPIETRKNDKARKKWLPPAPKLSSSQVARLSEINADLGIVSIASVVFLQSWVNWKPSFLSSGLRLRYYYGRLV